MNKINYVKGQVLGRATYIREVPKPDHIIGKRRFALFLCECGKEFYADLVAVKFKGSGCKECGLRIGGKLNKTHGEAHKTKEYKVWCAIKDRCFNTKCKEYHYYGGRGISMYKAWINNYPLFLQDIGRAPSPQHSLDRKNNNKNYTPKNIQWATKKMQARNRTTNVYFEYNGKQVSLAEIAEIEKVNYHRLWYVINMNKLSLQDSLSKIKKTA